MTTPPKNTSDAPHPMLDSLRGNRPSPDDPRGGLAFKIATAHKITFNLSSGEPWLEVMTDSEREMICAALAPKDTSDAAAMLAEKVCSHCMKLLPISQFRMWKKRASVKPSQMCDECRIADYAKRRAAGKYVGKDRRHARNREERHPEKTAAKRAVRSAVSTGRLVKPETCERCGAVPKPLRDGRSGLHGHHHDYSQPLVVKWLCQPCHLKEHREMLNVA